LRSWRKDRLHKYQNYLKGLRQFYLMNHQFIKGASSLLFIISAIKSFYCSNSICWKFSNTLVIIASYLCNAFDYHPSFLTIDYITIFLICTSYLNNLLLNSGLVFLLIREYTTRKTIDDAKNMSFAFATVKCVIKNYFYLDKVHYYIFFFSAIFGIAIYKIRYNLINANNHKYTLFLTFLMHICATIMMYVSSITVN
jgi:hypothetical protein